MIHHQSRLHLWCDACHPEVFPGDPPQYVAIEKNRGRCLKGAKLLGWTFPGPEPWGRVQAICPACTAAKCRPPVPPRPEPAEEAPS